MKMNTTGVKYKVTKTNTAEPAKVKAKEMITLTIELIDTEEACERAF